MFCIYRYPDGGEEFSQSSNIQIVWKEYQGGIHRTYHGVHIETYHQVIGSMPECLAIHILLPNFTASGPGMLK